MFETFSCRWLNGCLLEELYYSVCRSKVISLEQKFVFALSRKGFWYGPFFDMLSLYRYAQKLDEMDFAFVMSGRVHISGYAHKMTVDEFIKKAKEANPNHPFKKIDKETFERKYLYHWGSEKN